MGNMTAALSRQVQADTGVSVADEGERFFQQLALNVEAVSDKWSFNGYGLLPVADVEQRI